MNATQATPKFYLNVSSSNSGDVWPFTAKDDPAMDARIKETYYADEDESMCGFEVTDIEDLLKILKFYDGRSVRITMGVTVTTPEFETTASLSPAWQRGTLAFFRALEKEDLTPATAANKMIAIAHALSRWDAKQRKEGA
jgi:hypothetical protein